MQGAAQEFLSLEENMPKETLYINNLNDKVKPEGLCLIIDL